MINPPLFLFFSNEKKRNVYDVSSSVPGIDKVRLPLSLFHRGPSFPFLFVPAVTDDRRDYFWFCCRVWTVIPCDSVPLGCFDRSRRYNGGEKWRFEVIYGIDPCLPPLTAEESINHPVFICFRLFSLRITLFLLLILWIFSLPRLLFPLLIFFFVRSTPGPLATGERAGGRRESVLIEESPREAGGGVSDASERGALSPCHTLSLLPGLPLISSLILFFYHFAPTSTGETPTVLLSLL